MMRSHIFLLSLFLSTGYSLKCYHCTTGSRFPSSSCESGSMSDTHLIDCPANKTFCSKNVFNFLGEKTSLVDRSCSDHRSKTKICTKGESHCYVTCETDRCNSAPHSEKNSIPVLVLLFLAYQGTFLWKA